MSVEPVIRGTGECVACPGGPLLVRGDALVEDREGREHPTTRPVSAVCRCGRTRRDPWCDGTHKLLPERHRPA